MSVNDQENLSQFLDKFSKKMIKNGIWKGTKIIKNFLKKSIFLKKTKSFDSFH